MEEKVKEILQDVYYEGNDDTDLEWGIPDEKSLKAIQALIDQEVKKARISELKGLKMYDCFNEDYTNDPRPAKLVSIRLVELEKDNK